MARAKKVLEDNRVFPEPEIKLPEVKKTVTKIFTEGGFEEVEEPKTYERMPNMAKAAVKPAETIELYWEEQDKIKDLQNNGYIVTEARRTGLAYGKHKLVVLRKG
jgi:hypothetical protein